MAVLREQTPYGAFNFIVALGGDQGSGDEGQIVGGFSDVSGLGVDVSYSEYFTSFPSPLTSEKPPETWSSPPVLPSLTMKLNAP